MLVTFGRTNFHFVLRSHFENYSGSRSVVGKELKPKHLQEKIVAYFSICVGFRVRRTTFQSKPQQAENLAAKREKASDMKG